jgi:prepilin-type N-terminal cleavage/methylation domain-containing protein
MNRQGFTLIELMIVVVIISFLASIGIPKYQASKAKAYITAMKTDLRNLVNAEESYYADSAKFTTDVTQLSFKASSGVSAPVITVGPGSWSATNSHTQVFGMVCGIAINTPNPTIATAGEGEPVCK